MDILKDLENEEIDYLKVDGFDDCIIGICERFGMDSVLAYDYEMMIEKLTEDFMTEEQFTDLDDAHDASVQYFDFNIIGAWMGDSTPVFIRQP